MAVDYLTQQMQLAATHRKFRHYTSIDTLRVILSQKTLRLSVLEKMNDVIESERVDVCLRRKYFVSCFSHKANESIKMWQAYGHEENGACIEFRRLEFAYLLSHYHYTSKDPSFWETRIAIPIDIIYVRDIFRFTEPFDPCNLGRYIDDPLCCGYVKSTVWSDEQETRIIARVDVTKATSSIDFSMFKQNQKTRDYYRRPDFDYIFLRIPDLVLSECIITINPFLSAEKQLTLLSDLHKEFPLLRKENLKCSSLTGQLKTKDIISLS